MTAQLDYWKDVVSEALDCEGAKLTAGQIEAVALSVQMAHENYGMAFYQPSGGSHLLSEIDDLKRQLRIEQNKVVCPECAGRGHLVSHGPHHSATFGCHKCRGEGRVSP